MISIITITFNNKNGLRKTLDSIRNQSSDQYELIVVDGLSTDDSHKVICEYEDIISIYLSERDNGIYDAMNKGISLCNSDYIIFMNAGDVFLNSNVLFSITQSLDYESKSIYVGSYICRTEYGVDKMVLPNIGDNYDMPTSHQAMILPYVKDLSYDLKYRICADYNLFCFLRNKFPVIKLELVIALTEGGGVSDKRWYMALKEKYKINVFYQGKIKSIFNFFIKLQIEFIKKILRSFLSRKILSCFYKGIFR